MQEKYVEQSPYGKSIVIVGAGGNIGSHLVPHIGRLTGIARVTCIDRDVYEANNILCQDITPRDVGLAKASVQARRLRRIHRKLSVRAIGDAVENLPLGELRSDLILACLDSKGARRYVNQAAWRLGVPFVDAGVAPDNLLARVNSYLPGAGSACLECGWNADDYAAIEQTHPCQGANEAASRQPFPTNAPSSLGSLAASLQAIEAAKLLNGQADCAALGREVLLDARSHRHFVTEIRRRSDCRFDHDVWRIKKIGRGPKAITIGEALALETAPGAPREPVALRLEGAHFVTKLSCLGCGRTRKLLRLNGRLVRRTKACVCGGRMGPPGFDLLESLDAAALPRNAMTRSLASAGFRRGDVFTLASPSGETHYELGA